jgi:cellobiose phosphorylase
VVPERWQGFAAVRKFRGVTYRIQVRRAGKGNGVSLTVDGKPIDGAVVPPPPAGVTEVAVEVKLG